MRIMRVLTKKVLDNCFTKYYDGPHDSAEAVETGRAVAEPVGVEVRGPAPPGLLTFWKGRWTVRRAAGGNH